MMAATNGHRSVKSLNWAELRSDSPFPKTRERRSAYKRGLSYERSVGRKLQRLNRTGLLPGELRLGQWISFSDENGYGHAQPDAYLKTDDMVLLMEVKLTQTDAAERQLQQLYEPLLLQLYGLPVICLQVCENLRYTPRGLVEGPLGLLGRSELGKANGCFTWHFRND